MAGVASPYDDMHVGTFFSLAHKGQIWGKKHQLLQCHKSGFCLELYCP